MSQPRLITTYAPRRPEAAVLVLHGGGAREGRMAVSPAQLSVLRMVPVARRLARAGRGRLAVVRLLNAYRGWDAGQTPLHDVAWALGRLRERYDDLPVGLVGHSLGGRAALLAGVQPPVRSVVALNPWVYPTDDVDLTGRRVLVVHGTDDRVAAPSRAAAVVDNLRRTGEVELRWVEGGRHSMLPRAADFERPAVDFTLAALGAGPR